MQREDEGPCLGLFQLPKRKPGQFRGSGLRGEKVRVPLLP